MGIMKRVMVDKGVKKYVDDKIIIYEKQWLLDHLESEFQLLKKYREWKNKKNDKLQDN